ncbi:MAG: hypothetical protein EOM67_06735 [Spirochaetia bacterium]|nr:hypothetical protein [Spirochaetia bacterium]
MEARQEMALSLYLEACKETANAEQAFAIAASQFAEKETPRVQRKGSKRTHCLQCENVGCVSRVTDKVTILWCEKTNTRIFEYQSFERGLRLLQRGCLKKNNFHVEAEFTGRLR